MGSSSGPMKIIGGGAQPKHVAGAARIVYDYFPPELRPYCGARFVWLYDYSSMLVAIQGTLRCLLWLPPVRHVRSKIKRGSTLN